MEAQAVSSSTTVDTFLIVLATAATELPVIRLEKIMAIFEGVVSEEVGKSRRRRRDQRDRQRRNLDTRALMGAVTAHTLNGTSEEHGAAVKSVLDTLEEVAEIRWRRCQLRALGVDPDDFVKS